MAWQLAKSRGACVRACQEQRTKCLCVRAGQEQRSGWCGRWSWRLGRPLASGQCHRSRSPSRCGEDGAGAGGRGGHRRAANATGVAHRRDTEAIGERQRPHHSFCFRPGGALEGKLGVRTKDSANKFHPTIFTFAAGLDRLESMTFQMLRISLYVTKIGRCVTCLG
jgi:hypothetical protein